MMPAFAPASMAMLDIDILASMDKDRMAEPANSMEQPVPPAVPIREHMCRMISLDVTPGERSPSILISMFLALVWANVYIYSTRHTEKRGVIVWLFRVRGGGWCCFSGVAEERNGAMGIRGCKTAKQSTTGRGKSPSKSPSKSTPRGNI